MTNRAWILVITGYLILALGLFAALWVIHEQQEDVEANNDRLQIAAAIQCEVALQPDDKEDEALRRLSLIGFTNLSPQEVVIDPACKRIAALLEGK